MYSATRLPKRIGKGQRKCARKKKENEINKKDKETVTIHLTKCLDKSFRPLPWTGEQRKPRYLPPTWLGSAPVQIRHLSKTPEAKL